MSTQLPSNFLPTMSELHKMHELHSTQEFQIRDFPTAVLPPILGNMVREVARITQTPESMAGCLILGIISASIGKGIKLKGQAKRVTSGNLYLLLSAESGTGKTLCAKEIFKPLIDFDQDRLNRWRDEELPELLKSKIRFEEELAETRKELREAPNKEDKERLMNTIVATKTSIASTTSRIDQEPRLYVDNLTSEKMAHLLSSQPNECLASLSSDAADCIEILAGRYQKKDNTDENLYLKAFSGDTCRVDRVNGSAINLKSPHLAVVWLTQPDKVRQLYSISRFSDGGLMPRCLVCDTGCEPQERPVVPEEGISREIESSYGKLVKSLAVKYLGINKPLEIRLLKEAQTQYTKFFNEVVRKRRSGGALADINSYAARWEENALRIGLVLHAAQYGTSADLSNLSPETAQGSIELIRWFNDQQLRLLESNRENQRQEKVKKILQLIQSEGGKVTVTKVCRKRIEQNAESARALLSSMVNKGLLEEEEISPAIGKGGHIQTIYRLKK